MVWVQGIVIGVMIVFGVVFFNGFVGLVGVLFVQSQGVVDVIMGVGVIVIGLVFLIGGEVVIIFFMVICVLLVCVVGVIIY